GQARAALPGLEADAFHFKLRDVDVDSLWERSVRFDPGPKRLQRHGVQVLDEEDEMRIADIERHWVLEAIPSHRDGVRIHRIGEGNLVPAEPRLTDSDFHFGAEVLAVEHSSIAVDARGAGQLDDAPGRITAAFDLAAVAVPDAHLEVGAVARLEHDQLVAAYAGAPVGNGPGKRRSDIERRVARLRTSIDDHEIIAEAMHLVEVAAHWARDLGSVPDQVHLARPTMPRAANDVMQSIIFSAILDAIA